MTDEPAPLYIPRRQAVLAMAVFAVLALMLNTATFVNWAYEAPFPAGVTEWLILQAERVDQFGKEMGASALYEWVQGVVEGLREQ